MASKGTKPNSAYPRVKRRRTLPSRTIREIVRRVVQVAQPQQIILFGSAARGEMRPNSDVVVVTPDDLERCRDSHALIIAPAWREGKVVYAA